MPAPTPALEKSPIFAFEATNTDAFFRNGVKLGDDVLTVFDEGFYDRLVTVPTRLPVEQIVQGQPLTVSVWAGTKAFPVVSTDDNNDDFSIRNLRLALPDGRVLRPTLVGVHASNGATAIDPPVRTTLTVSPTTSIGMGDGASTYDYVEATFDVPDDAFDSLAHVWDTTAVADGAHTVAAADGADSVSRTVQVDNTLPTVTPGVEEGRRYRGPFTVDADATDAGSGLKDLSATLDGTTIALPYRTSSLELTPGDHTVVFTATDEIGNTTTRTVAFTTGDESSSTALGSPADGADVPAGDVPLSATPTSAEGDALTVSSARATPSTRRTRPSRATRAPRPTPVRPTATTGRCSPATSSTSWSGPTAWSRRSAPTRRCPTSSSPSTCPRARVPTPRRGSPGRARPTPAPRC